ncbi:MAG: ATP-dependent DNA ligase [Propionibacteriales bacterium]|nr:ATP-dependent DNA ligase [Propionibacteriales bacterium]
MERVADVPGPALATLTYDRFSAEGWIFERKLDGMRVLALRSEGRVRLRSRNGADTGASFPEVVDALQAQHTPDVVIDGEVVAFDGNQTSFARLQPRMHVSTAAKARRSGIDVVYYVFDVLHVAGHSTRSLPLRERKRLLRDVLDWGDPLRLTPYRNAVGEAYFRQACEKGWEGVIAKRADAPYRSGRTTDWLKFKCQQGQEFVVGGWTEPQGSRLDFGSLLIGTYDHAGSLVYAGRVGTGFDRAMLSSLGQRLCALARPDPPFDGRSLPRGGTWRTGVHWVEPHLVAQVGFTEWTRDGQLRHPRFLGLRDDKAPTEVVREAPRPILGSQSRRHP